MGILGKKNAKKLPIDSIIGPGMLFEGDIQFVGGLHIEGEVRGNIRSEKGEEALLVVSETGKIVGEVNVRTVIVNGTIIGTVKAHDLLELQSSSMVSGDMFYSSLQMQPGAVVEGRLAHIDESDEKITSKAESQQPLTLEKDLSG